MSARLNVRIDRRAVAWLATLALLAIGALSAGPLAPRAIAGAPADAASPTPFATLLAGPSPTTSRTPSATPSRTATVAIQPSATPLPATGTPSATATATPAATATVAATPIASPSATVPGTTATATATGTPRARGSLTATATATFTPTATVAPQATLAVAHYRIGWDKPLDRMTYVAAVDAPAGSMPRFTEFRARFQVVNDSAAVVSWKPRLEWSTLADRGFQPVRAGSSELGQPFYVRPLRTAQNNAFIPAAVFGLGAGRGAPQDGRLFTSQNPAPVQLLGARAYTEIEFSLRAAVDATYGQDYYIRLTDDGRALGALAARVTMGAAPAVVLTQPQYAGIPAGNAATGPRMLAAAAASPHGAYDPVADACARCHRSHSAKGGNILSAASPQSSLCFACHDGTGASKNIKSQFTDAAVPANNAATSAFYAHPATSASTHTQARLDEFKGTLNRHAECSDCHNAHAAASGNSSLLAGGYSASGALKGVSGVVPANGAAGTAPAFAWTSSVGYEDALCFKCHSSYTTLLSYTRESYKKSDKGMEFNPANASFHPVEGVGRNTSTALNNQLAGTSPYKLWTMTTTSLVRCVQCHGDYRLATPASPPAANARLSAHTSKYRGLLMNNYQDRVLKPTSGTDNYSAADFALCYQCHAEAPFADASANTRTDTNFRYHGFHLRKLYDKNQSPSTDIDTAGAGQGNAICAECHFRVHGQPAGARGNAGGTRLVNFAPNVTASGTQLAWDPATRTCYLTCHGENHSPERY